MSKMGYTDKPVEKLTEDSFGIKTYINGLCQFIVSCDTPMTISIQGDWGSGKTSM
ncbi:MAG: P-loop NTPase fold protein, partial [Clostridia bacterium]|nr:P-loop NTPase fold protein [Clostridia bacterium]